MKFEKEKQNSKKKRGGLGGGGGDLTGFQYGNLKKKVIKINRNLEKRKTYCVVMEVFSNIWG